MLLTVTFVACSRFDQYLYFKMLRPVFQITFNGRVPTRSFEGSIDVGLPMFSQVDHLFCQVRWPAFLGF